LKLGKIMNAIGWLVSDLEIGTCGRMHFMSHRLSSILSFVGCPSIQLELVALNGV
jgi:hypothetical protein